LSELPERAQRPSGLHDTDITDHGCPLKVRRHWPLDTSYSGSVWSSLPERAQRPSGLHDTEVTEHGCSSKVRFSQPFRKLWWARE